jgi:CHC2 zinc finger
MQEYHSTDPPQTTSRPERRGVSRKTVITVAKERIPTIALADLLCGPAKMRRIGTEWVGRCPLPDHEDKTPSFTVNRDKNLWFCHGCHRGGDVIQLALYAWGYEKSEEKMAAADLLREFGHEIPPRPAGWYAKQKRQKPIRDGLQEAKIKHLQRRIFRIFQQMIEELENECERREEARYLWDAAGEIAVCLWAGRRAA